MHLSVEATPGGFTHKEFILLLGEGGGPGVQEQTEFSQGCWWRGNGPAEGAVSSWQGCSHPGIAPGASVPGYTLLLLCQQGPNCASFLAGKIMTIGKQLVIM